MWKWISSVLLATLVVSGLSFPHPDDKEYKIPKVGTGRRSQYYVLHSDGSFKYGFDDGKGGFESVKSGDVGSRNGKFGYVDPDGNTIKLEYEAGEGGFVARGDHLPKASPELARALAAVIESSKPFVDPLASSNSDASYGFKFESNDHSRNEQSDADGTISGSYSYVDENGIKRHFNYRAGKGIGFVIEGDGLTQEAITPVARDTPVLSDHHQGPGVRTRQRTTYRSSRQRVHSPSVSSGDNLRSSQSFTEQQAPVISTKSDVPGDASYSFSYDADSHSRSETADPNLNVDGKYSFVADDGKERKVTYTAGSSTGFRAEGDHLPKAPDANFGDRFNSVQRDSSRQGITNVRRNDVDRSIKSEQPAQSAEITRGYTYQTRAAFSQPQPASVRTSGLTYRQRERQRQQNSPPRVGSHTFEREDTFSPGQRTSVPSRRVFEEANIRSSVRPQGSYSFAYDTSSHSRSEKGDHNNNVEGKFSFVADDDGRRREINYEAGSDTGFIAEGAHIPVGPPVPGAPSGQPTGRLVPVPSVRFFDPLANSDSDASYNFQFDSETYSRREKADEDGNVVGTYTVVNDDGTRVTYRFRAGKGIGFEQEEISRVRGPRPAKPIPYSGPLAGDVHEASQDHAVRLGSQRTSPTTRFAAQQDQFIAQRTPHYRTPEVQRPTQFYSTPDAAVPSHTHSIQPTFKHSQDTRTRQSSLSPFAVANTASRSDQIFPGFVLHRYDQTPTSDKFGYVLKYD